MNTEQLFAEVEDLARCMPPLETLHHNTDQCLSWLGRLTAFIELWNIPKTFSLTSALNDLHSGYSIRQNSGLKQIQLLLYQARHDLRMKTTGPLNAALGQGLVFDYFDEVRKIIEAARTDLFFIDRYLDAEFASRYLPFVAPGVSIRLLTRDKIPTLRPAVEAFTQQSGTKIQIRSSASFHDRYVIVDGAACYQSGASFKDGAKTAPTTLTQITDAFNAVLATYETLWADAKIEL